MVEESPKSTKMINFDHWSDQSSIEVIVKYRSVHRLRFPINFQLISYNDRLVLFAKYSDMLVKNANFSRHRARDAHKHLINHSNHFYRAMHFSAKRGIAIACRLSVCLSVCL